MVNEVTPAQIATLALVVMVGSALPVPVIFIMYGLFVASLLVSVIVAFFTPLELGLNSTVNVVEPLAVTGDVG